MGMIQRFTRDQYRRGLAEGTIYRRETSLRRFARWLDPEAVHRASTEHVQAFLDHLDVAPRTRYAWVSHLHCFYEWAVREGCCESDPTAAIIRPKLPQLLPRPISDQDLAHALADPPRIMRAWLHLGHLAGLRAAEVAGLERHWILDHEPPYQLRVLGKGNKERFVPLHPTAYEELQRWGLPRTGPVFTRARGGPYPAAMVSREANLYFDSLGIDATFHQLRHWFGTKLYRETRDLVLVKDLMGHSSIATTQGYALADTGAAAGAVALLDSPAETRAAA